MPQNQSKLNFSSPLVNPDGTATQYFQRFLLQLSQGIEIVSIGTPEAVIEAPQYTKYIDETMPSAPVMYVKMLPDVGGDRKKGWYAI